MGGLEVISIEDFEVDLLLSYDDARAARVHEDE